MAGDRTSSVTLSVRVIPRARANQLAGLRDGALVIRLAAPPVDGAANVALTAFLAERLDVPLRQVRLLSGSKTRHKRIAIEGLDGPEVWRRLGIE